MTDYCHSNRGEFISSDVDSFLATHKNDGPESQVEVNVFRENNIKPPDEKKEKARARDPGTDNGNS